MKTSLAAQQLKRLRERTKLTVREVAEIIGKPPSTYSSYEDKFKKPILPMDLLKALRKPFGERGVEWGELLVLAGVQDGFSAEAESQNKGQEKEKVARGLGMSHIDEIDASPSAGAGTNVIDTQVVRRWTLPENVVSVATDSAVDHIKILRVKGDSMMPTYNPLDRLMVDTGDTSPSPGGVFVVWDGLGFVVKRVQFIPHSDPPKVRLSSDNPRYDPYERILGEAFIQGRVIGKWLWT